MSTTIRMTDALARLKTIFQSVGAELTESDLLEVAGLDDDDCLDLLCVLEQMCAFQHPRNRAFIGAPSGQEVVTTTDRWSPTMSGAAGGAE